jgi:hypothetical protein
MKKDVTTFTRYFFLLLIVFIVWIIMIHYVSKSPDFATFFGTNQSSLTIIKNML